MDIRNWSRLNNYLPNLNFAPSTLCIGLSLGLPLSMYKFVEKTDSEGRMGSCQDQCTIL